MENKPHFISNEEVVLTSPGFYKSNPRSGWKPGHLYLTNFRLFLWQPARNIFNTSLESIVGIRLQKMGFILRSKEALCLSYRRSSGKELSQVWIMVKDVETWEKKIFERSLLQINDEAIERIAVELDPENKAIVSYIWQNRYATINELASLYDAPNHMEVLQRIRNVINPVSERTVGYPILVFERSKIDELTGKKILFSWWIIGADRKDKRKATFLDLFDEGDYLRIIMELFGVSEETIKLTVNQDKLIVCAHSKEMKYQEEIPLPAPVNSNGLIKKYKNGILEVRLSKMPVIVNHGNTRNITEDLYESNR